MGITGLLPFLERSSRKLHLREIKGSTVCIDTYCWLHKGAFGCAEKLARGTGTDLHIQYCMKYVNMLLSYGIKPILVFDGKHLPAKLLTEQKRRASRNDAKKRAAELLRIGKVDEARSYLQRSVDITHEMALELIKECRKRNIDTIVAPYEADGQLAYLNIKNIADYVISEDSDLLVFGCKKVLFKLNLSGNCILTEADKIYLSMGCSEEKFSFEKFRRMTIISGCDYLDSLPGIGLAKACKFVLKTEETDITKALRKIPAYLNMRNLIVTDEYIDSFLKAEATFKHMVVYDPINRQLTRLSDPLTNGTSIEFCCNAGEISTTSDDIAFQLALGNIDPFSFKKLDDWNPDKRKLNKIDEKNMTKHKSMWNTDFLNPKNPLIELKIKKQKREDTLQLVETSYNQIDMSEILSIYTNPEYKPPLKRICTSPSEGLFSPSSLQLLYSDSENNEPPLKKTCSSSETTIKPRSSSNPFKSNKSKDSSPQFSGTFLDKIKEIRCEIKPKDKPSVKLKKLSKFPRTASLDQKSVLLSKFFTGVTKQKIDPEPIDNSVSLKVEEILEKSEKKEKAIEIAFSSMSTEENVVDLTSYDKEEENSISKGRKQSTLSDFGFKKKEQLKSNKI